MPSISTFILTYNEEKHIERCVKNALCFSETVYIVDSYSTDKTVDIAESLGAIVYQNKWENNHSKQVNWALDNLPIKTKWVFRLDADEYLTDELIFEINEKTPKLNASISGITFERKMIFLNKLITKGMIQMYMLRMFRYKKGICEDRWMDEHIVLKEGESIIFDGYFIDHNLNTLSWWIEKHNNYATREAIELLNIQYNFIARDEKFIEHHLMSADAQSKRDKKKKYAEMPLFWRSFVYFIYRYFLKMGFLQGKEGFLWHFLQGWWYRTLVDAKIYEITKVCGKEGLKMKKFISENYNIKL